MTTLTAETPTLMSTNRLTNHALLNAMAALHRLNELGLRVRHIEASPAYGATLVLDQPPAPDVLEKMESALKSRTVMGLSVIETRVAHVLGCQVEWTIRRSTRADVPEGAEVAA